MIANTEIDFKMQMNPGRPLTFVTVYTCVQGYATLPGEEDSADCVDDHWVSAATFMCFKSYFYFIVKKH